jgi:hypothetical protein
MSKQEPHIIEIPLGNEAKLAFAKVMVFQFKSHFGKIKTDWEKRGGLYYPKSIEKFKEQIWKALKLAEEKKVQLIVFPELSVPQEMISYIVEWSKGKKIIIVAGSHYAKFNNSNKPLNASPVIYNGELQHSFKRDGAKGESEHIESFQTFHIFTNSIIGRFSVVICSDYLSPLTNNFRSIATAQKIDFCIVPAFQHKAERHLTKMSGDVDNPYERYIVYCNHKNNSADGNSALFGFLRNDLIEEFKEKKFTDYNPIYKSVSPTTEDWDYFIATVDTNSKRTKSPSFVGDPTPISPDIEFGSLSISQSSLKEEMLTNHAKTTGNKTAIGNPVETSVHEIPDEDYLESDYTILSKEFYDKRFEQFNGAERDTKFITDNDLIDPKVKADIKKSLEENSISFITAPIRFGKSFYLNFIKSEFHEYEYISCVEGTSYSVIKDETNNRLKLYHFWFTKIANELMHKASVSESQLSREYKAKLSTETIFKDWIKTKNPGGSDIHGLLKALHEFKNEINFKADTIILFNLDDIQKYVNSKVFQELKDDLRKLKDDYSRLSLKIVIASRYLPWDTLKNVTVKILPYFGKEQLIKLINTLQGEMIESVKLRLQFLIDEKTEGYPWFVIRFFKLYLKLRQSGKLEHPLKLAEYIFHHNPFWTSDLIFNNDIESEFYKELIDLITDSGYTYSDKQKFKIFIESDSNALDLNDGNNNQNDYLIRQSGYMKLNYISESFVNNGNYIMKTHYQKDIQAMLP